MNDSAVGRRRLPTSGGMLRPNAAAQPLVQPAVRDDPAFIRRRNCGETGGSVGGLADQTRAITRSGKKFQDGPITDGDIRSPVKAAPWNDLATRPYVESPSHQSFCDFKGV